MELTSLEVFNSVFDKTIGKNKLKRNFHDDQKNILLRLDTFV